MARKYDEEMVIRKAGGRFKLASLLEKRYRELLFGAKPLVDTDYTDPLDILIQEVVEDKVELIPEAEAISAATKALLYEPAADSERQAEKAAEESARKALRSEEGDKLSKKASVEEEEE